MEVFRFQLMRMLREVEEMAMEGQEMSERRMKGYEIEGRKRKRR